jgi:hypothetical protein
VTMVTSDADEDDIPNVQKMVKKGCVELFLS